MKIIADLHTHTLFSDHAYSTFNEMVISARDKGLKAIAITDHGPLMPDSKSDWHFFNPMHIPKIIDGVLVLFGAEANIFNKDGDIDIKDRYLKGLDWVIASIHKELIPALTKEEATRIWINIANNPYIDLIGHCEQNIHAFDIDKVVKAFAENNKVVEMNANSFIVRKDGIKNMKDIALACKKYNCKIAINSDAHSMYTIANVDNVFPILEEIEFPTDLIINYSWENLKNHLISREKSVCEYIN